MATRPEFFADSEQILRIYTAALHSADNNVQVTLKYLVNHFEDTVNRQYLKYGNTIVDINGNEVSRYKKWW